MAMAGGTDPSKLNAALDRVKDWVASKWVIKTLHLMPR
jgi:hypothetical protein